MLKATPLHSDVDCGDAERAHDTFKAPGFSINIDHHLSNSRYATINWVDIEATAAGEQIYRLALLMNHPINENMAMCLYTALMTDTGGFRFSNTDQTTFMAAAHLVQCGAKPSMIAEAVYESRKKSSVLMTGRIYSTLKFEFEGKFVWNEITLDLYEELQIEDSEPEGLSSDIRGIEGVDIAVLFIETPEHWCRAGFRSKGKVNVSELAQMLGGGGHFNASGAFIREPYEETRERCLATIREFLKTKYYH